MQHAFAAELIEGNVGNTVCPVLLAFTNFQLLTCWDGVRCKRGLAHLLPSILDQTCPGRHVVAQIPIHDLDFVVWLVLGTAT